MSRWLRLGVVAIALAALLAACGGDEEEAGTVSPTPTPARTVTPSVTKTPQTTATLAATKTATATAQPLTATPTVAATTPTPRPSAPTPELTQQARQPQWTVTKQPSDGQVQIVLGDGVNTYIMATVDPEWTELERWDVDFAADLNADGIDEAIVNHYTGGAHCCFEYWIFSQGPSGIQLDDAFSLTNGAVGEVQDLDGDGVPELEASDDRLAYFPDLGFAGSPFLPLVLCRTAGGTYSDCTLQFPEGLVESAGDYEQSLSDAVQRQGEDYEKRSPALGLLASYMRLGRDDEGWSKVVSLCPECGTWLLQNSQELENCLSFVQPQPVGQ